MESLRRSPGVLTAGELAGVDTLWARDEPNPGGVGTTKSSAWTGESLALHVSKEARWVYEMTRCS